MMLCERCAADVTEQSDRAALTDADTYRCPNCGEVHDLI